MANPGIADWQEAWDINEKLYNKVILQGLISPQTKDYLTGRHLKEVLKQLYNELKIFLDEEK